MSLTSSAITQLAAAAGFTGSDINAAAAIAMAESSGNPNALGDNGNSVGLWQINLPAHPEFAGWNLLDPQTNAVAAFQVYQAAGNSFAPWSTYNTGKFLAFLPSSAPVTIDASTGQIFPQTATLSIPPIAPAASSSIWATLAIAAAILFGIGFVLSED